MAWLEKGQNAQRADRFPLPCVGFPCHIQSMAASNRLGWQKNLPPLVILPFFQQGLALCRARICRRMESCKLAAWPQRFPLPDGAKCAVQVCWLYMRKRNPEGRRIPAVPGRMSPPPFCAAVAQDNPAVFLAKKGGLWPFPGFTR